MLDISSILEKKEINHMKKAKSQLTIIDQEVRKSTSLQSLGRVYLIGLPGVGKTTLGKLLAQLLDRRFLDLDHLLQSSLGMTVSDIFSRHGEPYFREQEALMLEMISDHDPEREAVIATGGGIILRADNRHCMRASGTVVYLDRSPGAILESIDVTHRPLMRHNPMRLWELNEERAPIYAECCHIRIPLEGNPIESLQQLTGLLELAQKSS